MIRQPAAGVAKYHQWEADINRVLSEVQFRLPIGGPVKEQEARCWRDVPSKFRFVPAIYLVSCEKPAGDNGVEMCDEHYEKWSQSV